MEQTSNPIIDNALNNLSETNRMIYQLMLKMIQHFEDEYRALSEAMITEWAQEGLDLVAYNVDDEIAHAFEQKLKNLGIPYQIFDHTKSELQTFVVPDTYARQLEGIAELIAKEHDRISEVDLNDINDLCFGEMGETNALIAERYELTVPDKLMANRLRENLTKNKDFGKRAPFAMTQNEDGSFRFYVAKSDAEKLNKAYFETVWTFTGRYALLNKKQEEYDLQRQEELKNRMQGTGHYFIVDPEIGSDGQPTGNILQKIEVTDQEIKLYKNGVDVTATIEHNDYSENQNRFLEWTDRQSRPIIVEENEMENLKETLSRKNPRVFLEDKDKLQYKADMSNMYLAEKRLARCFVKEFNLQSLDAIIDYLTYTDSKQQERHNESYIPKAQMIKEIFAQADPTVHTLEGKDIEDLDKVILKAQDVVKEQSQQILQQRMQMQQLAKQQVQQQTNNYSTEK